MTARSELADLLCEDAAADRARAGGRALLVPVVRSKAEAAADKILAAGFRKPNVLGYVVVSRDGTPIGAQFSDRATAQARADEWTNDCKTGGVDWDYRVAEIVEAAS